MKTKRPVGRPPSDNPAIKRIAVKVTPEQHRAFLALGASRWLKKLLDAANVRQY
jgi:hypothetical protein